VNESQINKTIGTILGDSKTAEVTLLPSGAVSIIVRSGIHAAVIDGREGHEWGVSIDPTEDHAFVGHDQAAASLEDALLIVQQGLCSGARSCV
jgi:hypothetical protein